MIDKLAVYLTDYVLNDDSAQTREICIYGAETALYSLFSTLWLLCVGLLFDMLVETLVIVSVFYMCQTFGGGKHAKTRFGCIGCMTVFLCAGLLLGKYKVPAFIYLITGLVAGGYLLYTPLILHSNKMYLKDRAGRMILRSRIITSAMLLLLVIIARFVPSFLYCFSMGLFFSAGSRLWAMIEHRCIFQNKQAQH